MKTILFFDRCELTELYAPISLKLNTEFNIIHVAFSKVEAAILKRFNITPDFIFQDLVSVELVSKLDEDILKEIDSLIIEQSNGRFTLNSSIQSDRGFALLSYEQAMLLAQSQYKVWAHVFDQKNINFFYHEPPSLFMNHIASFLCLKHNAKYCYDSMVSGEHAYNYIFLIQDTADAPELNAQLEIISEGDIRKNEFRIKEFISKFRETKSVFLGGIITNEIKYFKLLRDAIKSYLRYFFYNYRTDKLYNNIDYWLLKTNDSYNKLKNLICYRLKVKFDDFDPNQNYYYYSMNLEPEATVLYLGDGIYENQIKLIKNIASQLPPNTYLYVKDHPHFNGYRKYYDYIQLMNVPNIKLLKSEIPGKKIIQHSLGVCIVNGTAGFEAILMNKHVYTFGNMYFNVFGRVNYIKNIKDIRALLYANHKVILQDDIDLYKFVLAYLNSTHQGVTDYFQGRMATYDIDSNKNIEDISKDLSTFFKNN